MASISVPILSIPSETLSCSSLPNRKVVYIFDDNVTGATNYIPHLNQRTEMVHGLVKAYDLFNHMIVSSSMPATEDDLLTFHSTTYLEYLSNVMEDSSGRSFRIESEDEKEEFGLGYDCPTFPDILDFARQITGGTLTAVKALLGGTQIAINWCGGWHHAQRNEASGFCYVNDIVIGIQYLLKHFKKVLYVDLDAHHGDGVENAFSYSNKVMTLSLHNYEVGYFPGTGNVDDIGYGRGKYYSVNVPLKTGIVDEQYIHVFNELFEIVQEKFNADVIVVQCGTDCLAGDPLGNFNLTEGSLRHCVTRVLDTNIPTIFLGGGGYNIASAAKAWTVLTSTIVGQKIADDIPDHQHFLSYGPDFTLGIQPGLRKNENTTEYLAELISKIKENMSNLSPTPTTITTT